MESSSIQEKRFDVTSDSLDLMQKAKTVFYEIEKSHPYLSGIGFFGSRTKGSEGPESDMDLIIFYDANEISDSLDKDKDLLEIRNKFSESLGVPLGLHVGWEKNISLEKTDIDIYKYLQLAKNLNSLPRENAIKIIENNPEAQNLFSRFFLGVGDGLYRNRSYILKQFKNVSEGDLEFGLLMDALVSFEADNRIEDPNKQTYGRMPKTVKEAQDYFLTEINFI